MPITTIQGAASLSVWRVPLGAAVSAVKVDTVTATYTVDANGKLSISSPTVNVNSVIDVTSADVVLKGPYGSGGGGAANTTPVALSGAYTLTAGDDGKTFYCTTTLTITIPAGLSPMPQVAVIPPPTGSVTLSPTSPVLLSGVTADQAFNYASNPTGVALVPEYGVADSYGVAASYSWSTLPGTWSDNAALATAVNGKQAVQPAASQKTAAYTLALTDNGGTIIMVAGAADRTISLPQAVSTAGVPFRCRVVYLNATAAAGRLKLSQASGSIIKAVVNATGGTGGAGATAVGISATNLVSGAVFMGITAVNNVAEALVEADGTTGEFLVTPMCGQMNVT
jgi:hypothetical protein